jgi:hypothetical protein
MLRERILLPPSKWHIFRQKGKVFVMMFAHRAKSSIVNVEYECVEESSLPVGLVRREGAELSFNLPVGNDFVSAIQEVGMGVGLYDGKAVTDPFNRGVGVSADGDSMLLSAGINDGKVPEGGPSGGIGGHDVGGSENSSTNDKVLLRA